MASTLFSEHRLRGLTLSNRIAVAPMCQYMAVDGLVGDWHRVHLGQLAQGGFGLIIAEATAVAPEGRITPHCPGLYDDASEAAWREVIALCRSMGASALGVQLAHAGRKASTAAPWDGAGVLRPDEPGGWQVAGPGPLPYLPDWPAPHALDAEGIAKVIADFAEAAARAANAGFDLIELHAAHGYLLHSFLSPLSNQRDDAYGGSLENRMRLPLEVFEAMRAAFPEDRPLTVRISASDWVEGGWDIAQSIAFCEALAERGCDMIHVSSGGLSPEQVIRTGPGYQVDFAAEIKRAVDIPVMAVGQITEALQAETILNTHQADFIAIARAALWNPRWAWHAAEALGESLAPPAPYARCHPSLRGRPFISRR